MSSLFRANVGLRKRHWDWHKANPGQLSRLCQQAVDVELAIEALPDDVRQAAEAEAADYFFNVLHPGLQGEYAVMNSRLDKHEATEEQIEEDARVLRVDPEMLLSTLENEFARELYITLLRKIKVVDSRD